ncbi:Hypothetical protein SCF082_LOCUS14378 [Durusdinium trenchii]|uniref:Uncharacterized protein n=1 Tax=Durusdinium trenchii TaxID=1381693 RepID=A0ABP0JXS0_9DINO
MPLTDGGMQYLIGGARANLGIKKGRYLFEVKVVEAHNPSEGAQRSFRSTVSRNLVRVGFSTQGTSLLLGEGGDSVYFDNDGFYVADQKRDLDGVRVAQPQKLPEKLLGKVPSTQRAAVSMHQDGKYEVIFPVAVPDEGTFDWLDDFLDKNPKYVELSDRAIIKWAEKSGISHTEQSTWKHCNDKPDPQFRVPLLDDFSARRVIQAVASTQPRHYIVMEVKSNLVKEERSQLLKRFSENYFKTVAEVVMGEPPADFKEKVHKALLTEKQEKATQDWKRRKMEKEQDGPIGSWSVGVLRKVTCQMQCNVKAHQERLQRKRQRELEEAKKRAEEEAKRKLEELERQAAEAAAEAERAAQAAEKAEEEKKEGEKTEGEKGEGEAKTEVKEEKEVKDEPKTEVKDEPMPEVKQETEVKEEEPEELDEPCPQVVLTEEDKAAWFRKKATPDLTSWTLGSCFAKFSIPDKDEAILIERNYIRKSKISNRIEDLMPGDWPLELRIGISWMCITHTHTF